MNDDGAQQTGDSAASVNEILRGDGGRPMLLVVDDHPQNLELLTAYLDGLDCDVEGVSSGADAMAFLRDRTVNLVVLDVMMPGMSGFQVCEEIRKSWSAETLPVLVVTALSEIGDIERATDAGANEFISKPVDRQTLVDLVRRYLS